MNLIDLVEAERLLIFEIKDNLEDGKSLLLALWRITDCTVIHIGIRLCYVAFRAVGYAEFGDVLRLESHQESLNSKLRFIWHVRS